MKKIITTLTMIISLSSYATNSPSVIQLIGYSDQVIKLEADMNERGLSLLSIKDSFLESGLRPKCPCEKFEVVFKGNAETKSFTILSEGFSEKTITIKEN